MSNKLTPTFTVDGKDYEIQTTRKLLSFYNECVGALEKSPEEQKKAEKLILSAQELANDLQALESRIETAKNEYYDDPTNADKKAKYEALIQIRDDRADKLFAGSEQRDYADQIAKELADVYEKCIVYAIQEQHELSKAQATALWESFVDEVGKREAGEWIMEIGDTLFNAKENENSFLAKKRAMREQQTLARNKKR